MESTILHARGAYGRNVSLADWHAGRDFYALVEPDGPWIGGPYFSIRDIRSLKRLGYTELRLFDEGSFIGVKIEL